MDGRSLIRRSVLADADAATGTLDVLAVPYGVVANVVDVDTETGDLIRYREEFAPGAFAHQAARPSGYARVELHDQHDQHKVGYALDLYETAAGLRARFRIHPSARQDVATMLDDGLDGVSVRFRPVASHLEQRPTGDVVVRTKALVEHVALVPEPAYNDARVLAMRSRPEENPMPPTVDVDELLARLSISNPSTPRSTWLVLSRAAEHVVTDLDAANAAAPHGTFHVGDAAVDARIDALFASRLGLIGALPNVVEHYGHGMPPIPTIELPTAGPQDGEKQELPSDAFSFGDATPTLIDSTLHLNVSMQLWNTHGQIVAAVMGYAVAATAEQQVAAAVVADGTAAATLDAAFGAFTGPLWRPDLLAVAPADVTALAPYAALLGALNVTTRIVPSLTSSILADSTAIAGWLTPVAAEAPQPALLGRAVGRGIFGRVGLMDPNAVQVLAAIA